MSIFLVVFIVLFCLKVAGVIGLAWWLVFVPLWGPFVAALLIMFVVRRIIRAFARSL